MADRKQNWWKESIVYQILPASFKDSSGDGLGDIPGIISKLDYIVSLGVDTLWLCPMYDSPQVDMGYDIRNYQKIHSSFGTMADMDCLIDGCHTRNLRIILDLVINHTSDQHTWFQQSQSSKDDPKRDWYIWRPPRYRDGTRLPPNNWMSCFNTAAWTWHEATQEYYLHLFLPEQPDLNWDNAATRAAIYNNCIRFWLDKGVDGFRMDGANMYSKPANFPDALISNPGRVEQRAHSQFYHGPRIHEYLREVQEVLQEYGDIMTVGELPATPEPAGVLKYVDPDDKQLSMVFQFDMASLDMGRSEKFEYRSFPLTEMKRAITKWQSFIAGTKGWTTAFCESHDHGRSISRFASDEPQHRIQSAKMLATMMSTMTGTLFLFQGQEIGMINAPRTWGIEEYQDPDSRGYYDMVNKRENGDETAINKVMSSLHMLARDNARLPMQWDETKNAGFTSSSKPWMRVHDDYGDINVHKQSHQSDSTLNYWRYMLSLRKQHKETLIYGDFRLWDEDNEETFIYEKRAADGNALLVALNFTSCEQVFNEATFGTLQLIVSSYGLTALNGSIPLQPYEGRVYRLL